MVVGPNASAQSLKAPVVNTFKKEGGTIVADVGISPGQSSYRSEILKIYAAKPDVVFFQLDPGTGGTYFKEVTELEGTSTPYVGTDVTASADFVKAVGVKTAAAMITSIEGSSKGGSGAGAFDDQSRRVEIRANRWTLFGTRVGACVDRGGRRIIEIAKLSIERAV